MAIILLTPIFNFTDPPVVWYRKGQSTPFPRIIPDRFLRKTHFKNVLKYKFGRTQTAHYLKSNLVEVVGFPTSIILIENYIEITPKFL